MSDDEPEGDADGERRVVANLDFVEPDIAFRGRLAEPGVVTLTQPRPIAEERHDEVKRWVAANADAPVEAWLAFAASVRAG